ncbi:MAG: LytR C-terminal domain-containing protein [Jatrophihabitantaceae bacterium]
MLPLLTAALVSGCTHTTVKAIKSTRAAPTSSSVTAAPLSGTPAPHIKVLNGSGYQCASNYTAQKLATLGYVIDGVGNSDPINATVIRFPEALAHEANALREIVPGSQLQPGGSTSEVTLVIGQNAATVKGVDLATIPASCGLTH